MIKKVLITLALTVSLLLGACAPMPGPSIPKLGIGNMTDRELCEYADKYREGRAPMLKEFEECGPVSALEAYDAGRLIIHDKGQISTSISCYKIFFEERPLFATAMVATGSIPHACAHIWKVKGECKSISEMWVTHGMGNVNLLHEIRHAQGYADQLY